MTTSPNALPKYIQIAETLIREIASGRLADGVRLPPEREMAAEMGIAVGTLRKALEDLDQKGLLRRVHGSGNYVRYRPEAAGVYAFFRLERIEGGGLPTAEVLDVTRVGRGHGVPPVGWPGAAHRIRRLRRLSGQPVALEEIWLDARVGPRTWGATTCRSRSISFTGASWVSGSPLPRIGSGWARCRTGACRRSRCPWEPSRAMSSGAGERPKARSRNFRAPGSIRTRRGISTG